jgi:hypothetical protein
MSKVFRRPMFRGGSTNMNGIMSGIEDRKNYSIGTESPSAGDRYKEIYDKYAQPTIDPLGKYLIQGSLQGFSENRGGSTLGNLGLAFGGENLNQLFSDIEGQRTSARDMELAKLGYDIEDEKAKEAIAREDLLIGKEQKFKQDLLNQEIEAKNNLAQLKREYDAAQGDADRQNKIAVEIKKGENKIKELEFKRDNPGASEFRTEQVTPAFENVVSGLTETYQNSKNPAVKMAPDQTAFNVTKFRREADPKIVAKYKGFKPYTFDNKGKILELPVDQYKPGDIIYDPVTSEFLVFDNAGGTYRLNPLTYEIEE